jgi:hypothetical protein
MDLRRVAIASWYRLGNYSRQRAGPCKSACSARRQQRSHHATPVLLLAKIPDRAHNHLLRRRLEPHARWYTAAWIHAHVSGRILSEREPALGVVQLK